MRSPTPAIWLSPPERNRRSSRGSSNSKASALSMVSVSKRTNSGIGQEGVLRRTASKPVRSTISSSDSSRTSKSRMWGSMLGTVTIQSRS